MYFGMEIGTSRLLNDSNFVWSLMFGYIFGTIGVAILSVFLYKWIIKILEVPYWIYALFITIVVVYANMQYTGMWQDFALLLILSIFGIVLKYFNISRPAILVAYVVSDKIDEYFFGTLQLFGWKSWRPTLPEQFSDFKWDELFSRPIFMLTIIISIAIVIASLRRKDKGLNYT